jgi:hypothetical protein
VRHIPDYQELLPRYGPEYKGKCHHDQNLDHILKMNGMPAEFERRIAFSDWQLKVED